MTTETAGSGDIARTLELMWGTGERPTRGPKPGLTLDAIVTKAIEVADAEGLAAVSMRRLATELGTGTMSLYRYVPGKAELLDLMLDEVSGSEDWDRPEDGATPDWRETIAEMARGYLDLYLEHPWLLKINQARTVLGPSTIRSLDLALFTLRGLRLSDPEKISVIISVQSLATGVARMAADAEEAVEATGLSHEDFWGAQEPFLHSAMESGDYPLVAALSEETFKAEFDHLAFGVGQFVAGLDALLREREASGWTYVPPEEKVFTETGP
ncbi:TetR/AcrR family transcriptional regulator [Streptomyces sp. NPDC058953]|uniref:TetR/AcrR family transcriptional regulator n=1 Tax=unclassified Streptomyces TaxID=2593676 RepID=UPI003695CD32